MILSICLNNVTRMLLRMEVFRSKYSSYDIKIYLSRFNKLELVSLFYAELLTWILPHNKCSRYRINVYIVIHSLIARCMQLQKMKIYKKVSDRYFEEYFAELYFECTTYKMTLKQILNCTITILKHICEMY